MFLQRVWQAAYNRIFCFQQVIVFIFPAYNRIRIWRISAGGVFTVLAYYFAHCISRWKSRFWDCSYVTILSFWTGFVTAFQMDYVLYRLIPKHKLCDVTRVRLRAPGVTLVHPSNSTCPAVGRQCCQINKTFDTLIAARPLPNSKLRSIEPHNLSTGVEASFFPWDFPKKSNVYFLLPRFVSSPNYVENIPPWVSTDVWSTMFWSPAGEGYAQII